MTPLPRRFAAAGVALAIISTPATLANADRSLHGFWMDSHGEVILEISACGAAICGKVAWLKKPYGPDGYLLTDYLNADPALKKRPVCGLRVVDGFVKQADGTWGSGTVYVSDLGQSFSGYAEILSPNEVKVTGYVLLPIFGESEVWTRHTKPFPHCEKEPPPARRPATNEAKAPAPAPAATPAGAKLPGQAQN